MPSEWSSVDFGGSTFDALQAGLTVAMIATPRGNLKTCRSTDTVGQVATANKADQFDFLPVVQGQNAIVGMFHARAYVGSASGEAVAAHMEVLAERHLVGADTSILEFIVQADARPSRLVVAGGGFTGLVTLSDLQKLPVRASLFAAITAFEMTMTHAIRNQFSDGNSWKNLLSEGRRTQIQKEIDKSRQADGFVDELLFTQFCDKGTIISKALELPYSRRALEANLAKLQRLRDGLAHANDYAVTPDEARSVCGMVRELLAVGKAVAAAVPAVASTS